MEHFSKMWRIIGIKGTPHLAAAEITQRFTSSFWVIEAMSVPWYNRNRKTAKASETYLVVTAENARRLSHRLQPSVRHVH